MSLLTKRIIWWRIANSLAEPTEGPFELHFLPLQPLGGLKRGGGGGGVDNTGEKAGNQQKTHMGKRQRVYRSIAQEAYCRKKNPPKKVGFGTQIQNEANLEYDLQFLTDHKKKSAVGFKCRAVDFISSHANTVKTATSLLLSHSPTVNVAREPWGDCGFGYFQWPIWEIKVSLYFRDTHQMAQSEAEFSGFRRVWLNASVCTKSYLMYGKEFLGFPLQ